MVDVDLPVPGVTPNWGPLLNAEVQKLADATLTPEQLENTIEAATAGLDASTVAVRRAEMAAETATIVNRFLSRFPGTFTNVHIAARIPDSDGAVSLPMIGTLAASAADGATQLLVNERIVPGIYRVRGNRTGVGEAVTITAVTGSGPYTATLAAPLGAASAVTTLAADAAAGATSLSLTASVQPGLFMVGTEALTITAVTGSGPYTATLAEDVTVAKTTGATVAPRIFTRELDYILMRGIGDNRFAVHEMPVRVYKQEGTGAYVEKGSHYLNQLGKAYIGSPMLSVGLRDTGDNQITRTGSWAGETRHASAFGRVYRYANAGGVASWTSPVASKIGFRSVASANGGGLFAVTIDGDATKANLLWTAQQMVDAGRFANTILIANGGTLNPTDRVVSTFPYGPQLAGSWDHTMMIADGLSEAAHAVVFTHTGYQHVGASAARGYFTGAMSGGAAVTPATTGAEMIVQDWIHDEQSTASAWEYAEGMTLAAGGVIFIGNVHGYDEQTSFQIWDGDNEAPNAGMQPGSVVNSARGEYRIVRETRAFHPDYPGVIFTTITTYRLDRNGLRVSVDFTYPVEVSYDRSYAMLPVNGALSRSTPIDRAVLTSGPTLELTGGSGDAYRGSSKSAGACVWSSTGKVAAMMWMVDPFTFTDNWQRPGGILSRVQDRSGTLTKTYLAWTGTRGPYILPAGYISRRTVQIVLAFIPGGANAALAAI